MTNFEICGACNSTQRVAYAQAVYNAYGNIPYGASFVSQSFPFATMTLEMTAGQVVPSTIELENTGSKAWDANTKLGTTVPRDRSSAFADGTWLAPNRLAAVSGAVPPGGTYKFHFDLAAPMTPGLYDEHFGVVEEGVTWFGDPGEGGPPDDQLEVKIQVMASPVTTSVAATSVSSAATGASTASNGSGAGGSPGAGGANATASSVGGAGSGSHVGGPAKNGCTCVVVSSSDGEPLEEAAPWMLAAFLGGAAAMRRRRGRSRTSAHGHRRVRV